MCRIVIRPGALFAVLLAAQVAVGGEDPIVLDGSMGTAELPPPIGADYVIPDSVGRYAGAGNENLFHSFWRFDILEGGSATFTATDGLPERVIARVTGGSRSTFDGTFASEIPGADIFFINPSGIALLGGADFDVSGSLYLSTAHVLRFPEGGEYDFDTGVDAPPLLLSASAPSAFGFVGESFNRQILVSAARNLGVDPGKTLAFIGADPEGSEGGVRIQRSCGIGCANIDAPGASIEIASAKGVVDVPVPLRDFDPDSVDADALGEVEIFASATLFAGEADDLSTGDIVIRGGQFLLALGAEMLSPSVDVSVSGEVEVVTGAKLIGESIAIRGESVAIDGADSVVGVSVDANTGGGIEIETGALSVSNGGQVESIAQGSGAGGDVRIRVATLSVTDGGQVQSTALGSEAGGDVEIRADDEVRVSGAGGSGCSGGDCIPSEITSLAGEDATGNAGKISIETRVLEVLDSARIGVFTEGAGDAGAPELVAGAEVLKGVEIRASERIGVEGGENGPSLVFVSAEPNSGSSGTADPLDLGRVGNLSILPLQEADALALELRNGGQLSVSTEGSGDAGTIQIAANEIEIEGVDPATGRNDSGIFARQNNTTGGSGNAGLIDVDAQRLTLSDLGIISVETRGEGDAGTISLSVGDTLTVSGPVLSGRRGNIAASNAVVNAEGSPGEIRIHAGRRVVLLDGARITAETLGAGDGGDIIIASEGRVRLDGGAQVSAESHGAGNGGDIVVTAVKGVKLEGGAQISARADGAGTDGVIDGGSAGNVFVDAGPRLEVIGSKITTESESSSGGEVTVFADELAYLLDGEISTRVAEGEGTGGDILIDPRFVVLNEGRIVTDAHNAGKITIAGTLFVSAPFFASTPFSDLVSFAIPLGRDDAIPDRGSIISATSRASSALNGAINANAPETQLVAELAALPASYLDASALLASACDARTSPAGSFQVQSRAPVLSPPDAVLTAPEPLGSVPAVGAAGVDPLACAPEEILQ